MKLLQYLSVLLVLAILSPYAYADEICAKVVTIKSSLQKIALDTPFTCKATVDTAHAGSETIACGISINGNYPENFCPSESTSSGSKFGGWNGSEATFNCNLTSTAVSTDIKTVDLVAFDFRTECDSQAKTKLTLAVTKQSPTQIPTPVLSPTHESLPTGVDTSANGDVGSQGQAVLPSSEPHITQPPSISTILESKQIQYPTNIVQLAQSCMRNKDVYEQAAQATAVPWQILAGIHQREGNCNSNASLVSGRIIGQNEPDLLGNCSSKNAGPGKAIPVSGGCGFKSLLDSAIYSGNHLKSKVGGVPTTISLLTKALSWYNGGGNSNCGKTPYSSCPPLFTGEDDTYVMNMLDERHKKMFIVYCADYTLCQPPKSDPRPGVLTVVTIVSSL